MVWSKDEPREAADGGIDFAACRRKTDDIFFLGKQSRLKLVYRELTNVAPFCEFRYFNICQLKREKPQIMEQVEVVSEAECRCFIVARRDYKRITYLIGCPFISNSPFLCVARRNGTSNLFRN
jgi:hypothetical protein